MTFPLSDPFVEAWRLLRTIQVFPGYDIALRQSEGVSTEELRLNRAEREAKLFLRTLQGSEDFASSHHQGTQQLQKALKSVRSWASQASKASPWTFQWKQWRLKNWVLDVQEAQNTWAREIERFEIWQQALTEVHRGINQALSLEMAPQHIAYSGLKVALQSLAVLSKRLNEKYELEKRWLQESRQLVQLREAWIKTEDAKRAYEILKQWDQEDRSMR